MPILNNSEIAVYSAIKALPGLRKRQYASYLQMPFKDYLAIESMLQKLGYIYSKVYNDPVNMECYYRWYAR